MPSLPTELTATMMKINSSTTTTKSLFVLALHAWNQFVLLVVLAALLLLSPAAAVILLPVACMAVSVCLLCAIVARLLVPFVPPAVEHRRGGVRERRREEQDCIEVDRAEAPGGSDDDDASSAEEEHGELAHGQVLGTFDGEFSDPCDDEQRRFFFVDDKGSYCRTFYDLLAFWRSMERGDWRPKKRSVCKD